MSSTSDNSRVPRGRAILFAAAAIAGLVGAPVAGFAQAADDHKPICLQANRIDHTEILNNHQILFYMTGRAYGHKVWINNLTSRCTTLDRTEGFAWESSIPEYCDNLEIIHVLRTGETCTIGAFTPYEKAS
jgi:hypothetical protein